MPPHRSRERRPGPATTVTAPAAEATSRITPWPAWFWILAAWSAGAALLVGRPLIGRLVLGWSTRRARPLDQSRWGELVRETVAQLGIRRRVLFLCSDRATMPMTWGWVRPIIMLPAEADAWSPERRRDVLLHELAHVCRFDCVTQFLGQVACGLYWFNPLAWLAAHRMQIERERACDDMVLSAGARPSDYAGHLLDMARRLQAGRAAALATVAMARPSQLEGRLLAILDPEVRRGTISRGGMVIALIGLAAVVMPLSTVRLEAQDAGAARGETADEKARGPARSEPAKPQGGQAIKPPDAVAGKSISEWRRRSRTATRPFASEPSRCWAK